MFYAAKKRRSANAWIYFKTECSRSRSLSLSSIPFHLKSIAFTAYHFGEENRPKAIENRVAQQFPSYFFWCLPKVISTKRQKKIMFAFVGMHRTFRSIFRGNERDFIQFYYYYFGIKISDLHMVCANFVEHKISSYTGLSHKAIAFMIYYVMHFITSRHFNGNQIQFLFLGNKIQNLSTSDARCEVVM